MRRWSWSVLAILLPLLAWSQEGTTFRTRSTVVLVPALVLDADGQVVHGLRAEDFTVKDNGVRRTVHLDEEAEVKPVSLVVAIQTSRRPAAALGPNCSRVEEDPFAPKGTDCAVPLRAVATMLEPFLHAPGSQMAIVAFDSQVKLFQDFTSNTEGIAQKLAKLPEGDSGHAVLDALRISLNLFRRRPPEQRRVLVLISELRDNGSTAITFDEIARRITASNAEFYAIAFSSAGGDLADLTRSAGGPILGGGQASTPGPAWSGGPPSGGVGNVNLLGLIRGISQQMKQNIPQGVADLTGGEYLVFNNVRNFDAALGSLANHAQNRYQLSFQVSNPTPGPHKIEVFLNGMGGRVFARSGYWPETEKGQGEEKPAGSAAKP